MYNRKNIPSNKLVLIGRLMTDTDFKVGACVILKSGGPNMLIKEFLKDTNMCICIWINEGKIEEDLFVKQTICTINEYAELMLQMKNLNETEK